MKKNLFVSLAAAALSLGATHSSSAAIIFADTVLGYQNSGVNPAFPLATDVYGGILTGSYPVPVPLTYATDGNPSTFVSLPTGSFITLGFSGGFVFDGPGLDIFVSEVGGANETASIFVSSDFGATFTLLGTATTSTVSGFDLASISYVGQVNAVKIVGLDNFGGSPGFDLAFVQGLEGSVVVTAPDSLSTLGMLSTLLAGFVVSRSARRRRAA